MLINDFNISLYNKMFASVPFQIRFTIKHMNLKVATNKFIF